MSALEDWKQLQRLLSIMEYEFVQAATSSGLTQEDRVQLASMHVTLELCRQRTILAYKEYVRDHDARLEDLLKARNDSAFRRDPPKNS